MAKEGPSAKKNRVIHYSIKKSLNSVYSEDNPQQKVFMERAFKRKTDKINLKPNRFIDKDLISAFESNKLQKQSEQLMVKEQLLMTKQEPDL